MERSEKRTRSRRKEIPQTVDETDPAKVLLKSQGEAFIEALLVIAEVSPLTKSFLMAYFNRSDKVTEEDHLKRLGAKFDISPEEVDETAKRLIGQLREKAIRIGYRKEDF